MGEFGTEAHSLTAWGNRSSHHSLFVRRQILLIQYDPPFPLFDRCGADSGSFSNGWDGPEWVLTATWEQLGAQ